MAFLPSEIILLARDRHPAFTRERTPDGPALRSLQGMARRMHSVVRKWNPQLLTSDVTISLPLATFSDGHTFATQPDEILHGLCVYANGDKTEFDLISVRSRKQVRPRWAGWLEGGVLYLAGEESHWSGFTSIELKVIEPQADLTALSTPITLPDQCIEPLAAELAQFMARRVDGLATRDFVQDAREAKEALLDHLATTQRANVTVTREVW